MKVFVDKNGPVFAYLKEKFPRVTEAKIKEGIFVGPQIKKLFDDLNFSAKMKSTENRAWGAFLNVCRNFLVNSKSLQLNRSRNCIFLP